MESLYIHREKPEPRRRPGNAAARDRERVTGIEPALSAWEAEVLPLNYTRDMPPDLARDPGGAPPLEQRESAYLLPAVLRQLALSTPPTAAERPLWDAVPSSAWGD